MNLNDFMTWVNNSNPNQPEFIQAVYEIAQHVVPYINEHQEYGEVSGAVDYLKGANIAGFKKVADAMLAYGVM